ncbi:hypothetical protein Agub_g7193 [Astrephomene gubernaculifera]|uniref:Uncharacterized protein n=1 Tax=Astrephomene gubernaculifera TaxID=47775 RepID=A0AAD3HLK6_9CHLO|nr:hypothetical protein Agub_g7193 [Astrephomene gubernaculifera]
MEVHEERFRETTGRELLLSLSRLGVALSNPDQYREQFRGRLGLLPYSPDGDDDDDNPEEEDDSDDEMEEDIELGAAFPSVPPRPSPCSYLHPGRSFTGQQRLSAPHRHQQEDWTVTATIYSCDLERGLLTGSMVAQNNPVAKRPIVTYFEGEIIDNVNHSFWTGCKWGTCPSRESDVRYWSRCPGFSGALRNAVKRHDGRAPQLGSCQHIFMRWKEVFFVDVPQDCPLTITGFYYLSLDRCSGAIGGYYHDSRSAPLQVLQLTPVELCGGSSSSSGSMGGAAAGTAAAASACGEVPAGMAFGSYTLC